jgi:hypothetical protein
MPTTDIREIGVQISKDQMTATMQIPAGFPVEMLNAEVCAAQLEANRVPLTPAVKQQIQDAIAAYLKNPEEKAQINLLGQCPVAGEDGLLELAPECQRPQPNTLPIEQSDGQAVEDSVSSVDHYARTPYILVEKDQIIGRIIPPTDGVDGVDVLGNAVAARPGKPFNLKPHDSVIVDASANVVAQCEGVFEHVEDAIRINALLNIDGAVDFETGNVDFDGDVQIAKGVCENFTVCSTHSVMIDGVVEAANLKTGVDLILATGMFGKDKGNIQVERDCRAKFLQQTRGEIYRDLVVDKEIMNCELIVRGSIDSPHASLVGGRYHCLGKTTIKNIGSDTGVRTTLHIGSSPEYNRLYHSSNQKIDQLTVRVEKLQQMIDQLNGGAKSMAADSKEQVTELWCEQLAAQELLDQLNVLFGKVTEKYESERCAEVTVSAMVFPETQLVLGQSVAEFIKPLRGPVTLLGNHHGEICYRREVGDPLQSLKGVARFVSLS